MPSCASSRRTPSASARVFARSPGSTVTIPASGWTASPYRLATVVSVTPKRRQGSADHLLVAGGQDRVGQPRIDRLALGMELVKAGAVRSERSLAPLHPAPGFLG